jgi:phenylalanyl-tRNA synthetase alpha chain
LVELRENEAITLRTLQKLGGSTSLDELAKSTAQSTAAITRAVTSLQEKSILKVTGSEKTILALTGEGISYAREGTPERRLLQSILQLGGTATLEQAAQRADIPKLATIALGWFRTLKWGEVQTQGEQTIITASVNQEKTVYEKALEYLASKDEISADQLPQEFTESIETLRKRRLLTSKTRTIRKVELTGLGQKTLEEGITVAQEVSELTPELIASERWKTVSFRKYNITAETNPCWPGKKQPYQQFLDDLKIKLVELGFEEMTGPTVELMFFNCDALFMPQDHSAREIHDIYFIKTQQLGDLSGQQRFVERVAETHENGWTTGSTGWRYKYSREEAMKLVLRSQGTALSARMLVDRELKVPGKYFSIVRCFRPDQVDRTHLTEFNQVEGIVVGHDLSLRDLLGVLERFAKDIAGADKVRFKPDYFPFTEPSVELQAYKEGFGWIEFGGSGIFRPELTLPLGIKVPVIAWGIGVDRLFMMRSRIDDIRLLFAQDLDWIRKQKVL